MPSVFCGTYGKYNAGSLDGKWFDLEDYADKDEFYEACQAFHDRNNPVDEDGEPIPAEHEFMFNDFEDIPRAFISESGLDGDFWDYLAYEDHHDGKAKAAFVDWHGSWDESDFESAFSGKYDSELDYAYYIVDECGMLGDVSETMRNYFDYEAFARDLFINDVTFEDGFVFNQNY